MSRFNFVFVTIFLTAFAIVYSNYADSVNDFVISLCLVIYYLIILLTIKRGAVPNHLYSKWMTPEILFLLLF